MSINHGECSGQIIVGGMHGTGKTSLVQEIIRHDSFERLPALSTRAPRHEADQEYARYTRRDLEDLLASNALLNFDEVNGEVYAVLRSDFAALHGKGIAPVKEIHPSNFHKFEAFCENTFPVTLTNQPFVERHGRNIDSSDRLLADSFLATQFGKMAIDLANFKSTQEAANHVIRGFEVEKKYSGLFPDARVIDRDNEEAYSTVAPVFLDRLRLTTRDFHEASLEKLTNIISDIPTGSTALEIGTGSNWLGSAVDLSHLRMTHQESSKGMYDEHHSTQEMLYAPIRKLPVRTGEVDCVIGSLVDGMLYPQALLELNRVLKSQGKIIVTYPSRKWADETRSGARYAEFSHQGAKVSAHSFSPNREEVQSLFADTGIELVDFLECEAAPRDQSYYSPALFNANGTIPDSIVTIAIGKKV